MSNVAALYTCPTCGHSAAKWFGKCPSCGAWGGAQTDGGTAKLRIENLSEALADVPRLPSGIGDVDRVLGGGFVKGSVVLLAGEPGIGKSTLTLQLVDATTKQGARCMLISGEESLAQISLRGRRLGCGVDAIAAASATSLQAILEVAEDERPDLLVLDSIQTLEDAEMDGSPGSLSQVRGSCARVVHFAKSTGTCVVLIGHVTKEGNVAGPKTLEHMVDVIIDLSGERSGSFRMLRGVKNRFGSCEETGVFSMEETGLVGVEDPSKVMLEDRCLDVPGTVVFAGMAGTRPLLIEIQALVATVGEGPVRRVAQGFDHKRLALLLAVLHSRCRIDPSKTDVFLGAAGGLRLREPAADLAVCLALASALADRRVPADVVAVGEVGLGGEVRRVPGISRRLAEAARLGFTRALVPRGIKRAPKGIELIPVEDVSTAVRALDLRPERGRPTA